MRLTYRRPGQRQNSSVLLNIRVTPEEADEIKGLAYYLRVPYSEMLRTLAKDKRRQLLDEGKRPPLRPPAAELQVADAPVPKLPRR